MLVRRHAARAAELEALEGGPLAVFAWLEGFYARDGSRGCAFVNAAAELAHGGPGREAAARDAAVNLLPLMREALRARCTIGEVCNVLRAEWGEHDRR